MKSKKISANISVYIALLFGLSKCVITGPVPCTLSCVQGPDCKNPTCICPKGFSKHPIFHRLCNPICSKPCLNGTCIQPELCYCKRGFSLNQSDKYECVSKCTTPCKNGICLSPNVCTCKKGYELDRSNRFLCNPKHPEGCVKNGKANGKCPEKSEATCSRSCTNGRCVGNETCECFKGFALDARNKYHCIPVCTQGCQNGMCSSSDICSCNVGFILDGSNKFKCNPKCAESCINGQCIAPDTCECKEGYILDSNNTYKCVAEFKPVNLLNSSTTKKDTIKEGKGNEIKNFDNSKAVILGLEGTLIKREATDDINEKRRGTIKGPEGTVNVTEDVPIPTIDNGLSSKGTKVSEPPEDIDEETIRPDEVAENLEERTEKELDAIKQTYTTNENVSLENINTFKDTSFESKPDNLLNSSTTKKDIIKEGKGDEIKNFDSSKAVILDHEGTLIEREATDDINENDKRRDIIKGPEGAINVAEGVSIPTIDNNFSSEGIKISKPSEDIDEGTIRTDEVAENLEERTEKGPKQTYTTNEDVSLENINISKDTSFESKDSSTKDEKVIEAKNADINPKNVKNSEVAVLEPKDVLIKDENGVETIPNSITNTLEVATIQTDSNHHFKHSKTRLHESENILIEEAATESTDYDKAGKDITIESLHKDKDGVETINSTISTLEVVTIQTKEIFATSEDMNNRHFKDSEVHLRNNENILMEEAALESTDYDDARKGNLDEKVGFEETAESGIKENLETLTKGSFGEIIDDTESIVRTTPTSKEEMLITTEKGDTKAFDHFKVDVIDLDQIKTENTEEQREVALDAVADSKMQFKNAIALSTGETFTTNNELSIESSGTQFNNPEKSFSCAKSCVNGKCTGEDACGCNLGYEKNPKDNSSCVPSCTTPCNNGRCVAPEVCQCHETFEFNSETKKCELKGVKGKSSLKSEAATLTRRMYEETICLVAVIVTSYFRNAIFQF